MDNNEIMIRMQELLRAQGKKQKELTDYLGITANAFTDWKSGRIRSYTKHLPKIAEFLGVSVDYLVGQSESSSEDDEMAEYLEELRTRPELKMLFSLAKGATKEDVEQAVAIIEALRKTRNE